MSANPVKGLVSTIIPVYNREEMILSTVQSVLDQTYRPIEIILINDGSTDQSGVLCDELSTKYPDSITIIHQPNSGVAMAREAGRKVVRGEFVQHLDSDDLLLPNRFDVMVKALNEHPDCDIAYSRTDLITFDGHILDRGMRGTKESIPHIFPRMLNECWWPTGSPLYRRTIIDEAGPWLNLKTCEDWEYDARLGRNNLKLCWVDRTLTIIRRHEQGHLSEQWLDGPSRYLWATSMLSHAKAAGMVNSDEEVLRFKKYLQLLARQYWQRHDSDWAERLYELSLDRGSSLFDRLYFSIAKRMKAPFVNASERLYRLLNT